MVEEFPEHAADRAIDRVVAEMKTTLDLLAEKYHVRGWQREIEKMQAHWQQFPTLDSPAKDKPSHERQLLNYLADWLLLTLTDQTRNKLADVIE